MVKVFISSTSRDLGPYRSAAIEVCNRLGVIPLGMEFFGAMGAAATEGSKRRLDEADVYVGTFARRYGFIESDYDLSVTELEYEYAGQRGLDRLCFVLDPGASWPEEHVQADRLQPLQRFLDRVEQAQIRELFTSVDDYRFKLIHALSQWVADHNIEGRADRDLLQPPLQLQTFRVTKGTRFHFRAQRVPFVGRESELAQLDGFLDAQSDFAWWIVTGEAGSGKSRLALELCFRRQRDWTVGFLPQSHDFERWMRWQPERPTLIVVDYAHARASELQAIVIALASRSIPLAEHVRLLLLERRTDGEWWDTFLGVGTARAAVESSIHGDPLPLPPMRDEDLWQSVTYISEHDGGRQLPSQETFIDALRSIDPLGRPLFAVMAAEAVQGGRELRDWDRDALLRDVLQRERESYWRPARITEKDRNLLTVATMIGGLLVSDLQSLARFSDVMPSVEDGHPDRYNAERYEVLVGRDSTEVIPPLEPDLIGEFFVLEQVRPRDRADWTRGALLNIVAWLCQPMAVFEFITRASQDFDDHPAIDVIKLGIESMLGLLNDSLTGQASDDYRSELLMALCATQGNLIHHDCERGQLAQADTRLSHLWEIAARWPELEIARQIAAAISPTVIGCMIRLGDRPWASAATTALFDRVGSDGARSALVVQAFGMRANVAAEDSDGALAVAIFGELEAFAERTRHHPEVIRATADATKELVHQLIEARLWPEGAGVFFDANKLIADAPPDVFSAPLVLAAVDLLLNASDVLGDEFGDHMSEFQRVFTIAEPLAAAPTFEIGLPDEDAPDIVEKVRTVFAKIRDILAKPSA